MNKLTIKILLLLGALFLFLGVEYSNFTVASSGNNVVLSWQTGSELNLKEITIERKIVNGVYSAIGTISAKGDNSSYSYVDENVYKVNDAVYTYQLRFINLNGDSYISKEKPSVAVLASVSKKTWGSIKALFR
jgi:hypothetical protein